LEGRVSRADSSNEALDNVVNYSDIRKYASLLQRGSKELKDKLYPLVKNLTPPAK